MSRATRAVTAHALAFAACCLAAPVLSPVAEARPPREQAAQEQSKLERFLNIRAPASPTLLPDGSLYFIDRPDGILQLYRVQGRPDSVTAASGGPMTRLTDFPDGISDYTISHDGRRILVGAAPGGNENTQYSLLDPDRPAGANLTPILANPKVQYSVNLWLSDSSGFIYTANDDSAVDFHVYRYDFTPDGAGKTTKLLAKEGTWFANDTSPSADRVLVGNYISISNSAAYELNPATGELTDLSIPPPDGGTSSNSIVGYMPGLDAVLLISDADEGLRKLHLRDLKSGAVSRPIPSLDGFELSSASINLERTLLAVTTNEDGYGVFHLYRLPSFEEVPLPAIERGIVGVSQLRGDSVIWTLSSARSPGISFAWDASGGAAPRQLTFADTCGIDLSAFPLPDLIKYKAFDGRDIPAFVYYPVGYRKDKPIPFIVNYHGGPEGQSRPGFNATHQYLVSEGFGIIQPNVRGSLGYGRAFHMLDDYKGRWDSVKDGVDAAAWLVTAGLAKPGHIAAYGGSYGGYMTVACIVEDQCRVEAGTQKERLFGAGVNIVGIVNLKTFLEQTSGYRRKLREVEYGPLTDPDFLMEVSTINKIDKINVPIMIGHGLNDPRVPVGEAMQLAVGLRKRGIEPLEMYFPDEGHGFAKVENRLLFTERMVKFLRDTIGE